MSSTSSATNASSSDSPSTARAPSAKIANTACEAARYCAKIRRHDDELRTAFERPVQRHRGAHAERARFVRRGQHDGRGGCGRRSQAACRATPDRRAARPMRRTRRGRSARSSAYDLTRYVAAKSVFTVCRLRASSASSPGVSRIAVLPCNAGCVESARNPARPMLPSPICQCRSR